MRLLIHGSFLLLLVAGLAGCDSSSSSEDDPLAGGVLATFDVEGETFRLWTTNPQTIEQLFDLQAGTGPDRFPNGPLLDGPGVDGYNEPWSWHLDPAETTLAEMTIEVCSGVPSYVEEELNTWINDVGRYCPWAADLVSLADHR